MNWTLLLWELFLHTLSLGIPSLTRIGSICEQISEHEAERKRSDEAEYEEDEEEE